MRTKAWKKTNDTQGQFQMGEIPKRVRWIWIFTTHPIGNLIWWVYCYYYYYFEFFTIIFDIINLYHPTHHVQVYKYSVPVKEALDLTNHLVSPTSIYVFLSWKIQRYSEAAAAEAAEAEICTLWAWSKSPPPPLSNSTKYPPPALELLAFSNHYPGEDYHDNSLFM